MTLYKYQSPSKEHQFGCATKLPDGESPYIPFYAPAGMGDEEYQKEASEAQLRFSEWENQYPPIPFTSQPTDKEGNPLKDGVELREGVDFRLENQYKSISGEWFRDGKHNEDDDNLETRTAAVSLEPAASPIVKKEETKPMPLHPVHQSASDYSLSEALKFLGVTEDQQKEVWAEALTKILHSASKLPDYFKAKVEEMASQYIITRK